MKTTACLLVIAGIVFGALPAYSFQAQPAVQKPANPPAPLANPTRQKHESSPSASGSISNSSSPSSDFFSKNFTLRLEQTGTTAGAPLEKNSSLLDGEIKPAPRNESEGSKPLRSATVRDDRPKPFTENTRQGGMWMRNPVLNSAWGFQPPDYDGPSYQAPIKNGDFLTPLERSRFRIPAGKYEPLRPIRDPINK